MESVFIFRRNSKFVNSAASSTTHTTGFKILEQKNPSFSGLSSLVGPWRPVLCLQQREWMLPGKCSGSTGFTGNQSREQGAGVLQSLHPLPPRFCKPPSPPTPNSPLLISLAAPAALLQTYSNFTLFYHLFFKPLC